MIKFQPTTRPKYTHKVPFERTYQFQHHLQNPTLSNLCIINSCVSLPSISKTPNKVFYYGSIPCCDIDYL